MTAYDVSAYVAGRIDIDELERRIEHQLLREVGRRHPVPPGWQPLPNCAHDTLIEITSCGDWEPAYICRDCGDHLP